MVIRTNTVGILQALKWVCETQNLLYASITEVFDEFYSSKRLSTCGIRTYADAIAANGFVNQQAERDLNILFVQTQSMGDCLNNARNECR